MSALQIDSFPTRVGNYGAVREGMRMIVFREHQYVVEMMVVIRGGDSGSAVLQIVSLQKLFV